jgi:hypothetical protein
MSWEADRGGFQAQGGSLQPGYTVEEPDYDAYDSGRSEGAPGVEIPRGGDDELLEMIEAWHGASPEQVAAQFNERGDDLLESFLHRHEADLADGVERRLREYLHALEAMGARYFDEGGATGAPAKLKHLLQTQVVPIVKDVLRAHVRQKQARGGRDRIPGRASEARDQRDISERQLAAERIESSVRRMEEYNRVQEYQNQALRGLSTEDEMNMHSASKEILKRQIFLWDEANRLNQGAFSSTITRLQRELRKTEAAIQQTMGALHGEGYAAAQAQVDRSLARPGDRPGRPWAQKARQTRAERVKQRDRGDAASRSRSESELRLRGGVGSPSASAGRDSRSGSRSASSDFAPRAQRFREEVPKVLDPEDDSFLGYIMPFSAPAAYEDGYGVKARDVVDLFSVFHRHLDYESTAKSMITVMSNADPKFGLDKTLPDSIMRIEKNKKDRNWKGRTLGEILKNAGISSKQAGARGEVDAHDISEKFAFVLIKQGKPGGKPRQGFAADASARADAVRPSGLLIEMFNAWRLSAAAQQAKLNKTDALQLFSYHRPFSARPGVSPSVSRGPSAFREGVEKMGLDRTKLKLIGSLFGTRAGESSFNPTFWAKSMQAQLAWMKSHQKGHNAYKTNNWITVLEGAFEVDVEGQLGITKGAAGSYDEAARERIWGAVSAKMKQFMSVQGITSAKAGDYLAAYAAGQSPSPSAEPDAPYRRRGRGRHEQRDYSREPEDAPKEEELGGEPPGAEPRKRGKRGRKLTEEDAKQLDVLGLKPFPKPGSYPQQRPGSHLYKQWETQLSELPGRAGENLAHVSETLENNLFHQLKLARGRRLKNWVDGETGRPIPSQFNLYTNLRGGRTNADYESFRVFLDKAAWNEYIRNLGEWMDVGSGPTINNIHISTKRKDLLFTDIPDSKFIFEQVFRPDKEDHLMVTQLLQKWLGARIWNLNTRKGKSAINPAELLLNVKKNWDDEFKVVAEGYQRLEASYAKEGRQFPVPDWKERLFKGNQIAQLTHIYEDVASMREEEHVRYHRPSTPEPEGDEKAPDEEEKQGEVPKRGTAKKRPRPRPRRPRVERGLPLDIPLDEPAEEIADAPLPQAAVEVVELDPLMDLAAEDEADIERYYARVHLPIRSHSNQLRAEVVLRQNYEALNGVHLMQTDNDVQPAMGAVHIVQPASNFSDKHFMYDVEGDINEGQKVLVERSKRGPFRQQSGRSTVMDRSAHVTYRKRAGAFEITVRRGAINAELQQMLSKLSMHRMSVHGSHVVIIKGTKRYRLGPLAEINLRYLRELVDECLQQYGSCGLEITETRAGRGAIYKGGAHSAQFKSNARKKRGPATRRR